MNLRIKISLSLAFAVLTSLPLAAESPLSQAVAEASSLQVPQWTLDALRDFSKRGMIDANLPEGGQGVSREQLALLSAQAFNAVRREDGSTDRIQLAQLPALPDLPPDLGGSALPPMGAGSGDRETVYKLVQEYHDELVKLGAKGKDLTDQLVALKTSQNDLMKAFDRVINSTGIKLNGEATIHSVNDLWYPTNFPGNRQRVWPTVGYFDFKMSARPRKEIYAEVVYRMEKVFGGFWGALDVAGVRNFYIKVDTDIGFELGKVSYKRSPLTLWAQEDSYPNEVEVLARKRREGMAERYLGNNEWPLQGGRAYGTLVIFDSMDLDLSALGARLAINSTKNSPLDFGVIMPYDQWLVGGTAEISGSKNKDFVLGATYFEINESVDTNTSVALTPQQRNWVFGGNLSAKILGDEISLQGEWASSGYNGAYGTPYYASWTAGSAAQGSIVVKGENNKLVLQGVYVEETFINYAAQTRIHDTMRDNWQDIPRGSNLFDPRRGAYGLIIGDTSIRNFDETRYNDVIFATNQARNGGIIAPNRFGIQPGGVYLTHGQREQSLPMGLATPNRAGYGADFQGKWFDGLVQPSAFGGMYHEIVTPYYLSANYNPRTYTKAGGGLKFDMSSFGLPLTLRGGAMYEDTRSEPQIAFTSMTVDYDLDWELFKKVHLILGFEHIDWNGGEFWDFGGSSDPTWVWLAFGDDIYTAAIDWNISKSSLLYITYAFHDIYDSRVAGAGYSGTLSSFNTGSQEIEAKFTVRF